MRQSLRDSVLEFGGGGWWGLELGQQWVTSKKIIGKYDMNKDKINSKSKELSTHHPSSDFYELSPIVQPVWALKGIHVIQSWMHFSNKWSDFITLFPGNCAWPSCDQLPASHCINKYVSIRPLGPHLHCEQNVQDDPTVNVLDLSLPISKLHTYCIQAKSTWGQVCRCLKTSRWFLKLFVFHPDVKMPTFMVFIVRF